MADSARSTDCGQSERFGSRLIMAGDSERRVIEAGPDRTVRLETREGGAAGYRHDFYRRGVTIQVYVQAGRVVRVCRMRD
ncbi:DUF2845 domain-containing protein [Wenzhouxiangella sp. C33]|uniref:DUF2845 domain-containing protein n=1 Tax=Wenzhouxiangella limi TaxID=2707351 RepID=A0A845UV15_9GAMM|nr:DUF2845 domain-containing protein [Wenzhouxiangella limi]